MIDMGKYGFGTVRSLSDYEKYAGINFKIRGVQQYTLDNKLAPNPIIEDPDEYENSFLQRFKHCIDLGFDNVPYDDYEFWAVIFEDENGNLISRKDADKEEIKLKMVKQFQASKKGFTENKLDGKGKIKLAKYFVYVEVYDFSVDEQETFVAGKKTLEVTTRLGLQIRFADAESGEIKVGSGMGEATQYGQSFLKSLDMKFAQSTIGISTRKALETGCSRVITKMIKDGVFEK
jgi:hypothetical protein